ncbi:uncharacterized protein LOC134443097 [Engraulis encrasicolus]|uniref:uncharacterized protein LOC134443097 n=1 Tax=Engraulis encrasicolus TaxID=184585 RepID=UPI002FD2A24D
MSLPVRSGSIVTDAELIFRPGQDGVLTAENVTDVFIKAVENGDISFPVIPNSINVTAIRAPPTTQSPSSTQSHMTSTPGHMTSTPSHMTSTPPENNASSSTPAPPERRVAFGLSFSSNETFTSSLGNHSSEDFLNRVNLTKAQIEPIYRNVSGFIGLNVLNFMNGSIVTDAELIFRPGQDGVLSAENVTDVFIRAVERGDVSFPVIPNSINVTVIRVMTTQSPSSTQNHMTSTQSTHTTTVAAASAPVMMKSLLLLLLCSTAILTLNLI